MCPRAGLDGRVLARLAEIVGPEHVLAGNSATLVYECDGFTLERQAPVAVVLPGSAAEVAQVVRVLHAAGVAFVPRGAGTSLSGATVPPHDAVVISLARMNRILHMDFRNRRAVVEPGVVNAWISREAAPRGYFYAPDPSSQAACTIGGNVGTNAGGPHTLKYGVTVNHILGVELVLPDGQVVELGGQVEDLPGYDLVGLVTGSEGTLGIVTKIVVRLVREPEGCRTLLAVFDSVDDATRAVSGIIEQGIIPAALEMMDNLVIQAVEEAFGFGFPLDAAAVLIIEVDGLEAGLDEQAEACAAICRANRARELRTAATEEERRLLWMSRKKAFGALGRIASSYVTQDGVVPRTRLPEMLALTVEIGRSMACGSPTVLLASLRDRLLPYPGRLAAALRPVGSMGGALERLAGLLPADIRRMLALLPPGAPAAVPPLPPVIPAQGRRRYRVALLTGCVAQILFPETNWATARVLAMNGCEVVVPAGQGCCGALHLHSGAPEMARGFARRNVEAFELDDVDAVITNVAGCGSTLKEYGHLLQDDAAASQAARFAGKVRDVTEFLAEIGIVPPTQPVHRVVAYHDACHLAHGQGIRNEPRQLLRAIPGLRLVELREADHCCGSAGLYNILQPGMAARLLEKKIAAIAATGADTVATGNPGCLMQIAKGLREHGLAVDVRHPVELLAEAYGFSRAGGFGTSRNRTG